MVTPIAPTLLACLLVWALAAPVVYADESTTARSDGNEQITFEDHVRPLLRTHCFHCHGEAEELGGDLDLRLRRSTVAGGESGPAVVPGSPDESYLLDRVLGGEMPPEDVPHRPTDDEIEILRSWIAQGAPTRLDEPEDLPAGFALTRADRSYWALQPPTNPPLPPIDGHGRVRTTIDAFVLHRLEAVGAGFAPDADRRALIRRASLDLLGLPPDPAAVEAFVRDSAPDAYERLVDRLLASPHYGERWGRHWLDVAGYADSEGYTLEDPHRPDAFRYRDYVIRAWNDDKPYSGFIEEQLAGDEGLTPPYGELSQPDLDRLTATGFLRMAPDGTGIGGVEQDAARNEVVSATVEIVATSLLGLTLQCAQCHHHRYDPLSHQDYYRLRAIFEPALNWKNWKTPAQRRISLYTDADRQRAAEIEEEAKRIEAERLQKQAEFIARTFEAELAKLPEEIRPAVRSAYETAETERSDEQKALLREHPSVLVSASSLYLYDKPAADELQALADQAAEVRATKPEERFVRAVIEPASGDPPTTFVFLRGEYAQPGEAVEPGIPQVFPQDTFTLPSVDEALSGSGRRTALARWLTRSDHPLTSRVLVNRVWLHHFGRGLVDTPGDFGRLGSPPSHPELLDHLAVRFVEQGWSIKQLHREIMLSTVYRQQSSPAPGREVEQDAVRRLAAFPLRRLESETLRDSILAVSGRLNRRPYGPPVPVMADEDGRFVIGRENLNAGRPGPVIDMGSEPYRRSVYVEVRRSRPLSVLEPFDAPAMTPNCTRRSSSTDATQALMLMNGDFLYEAAQALAAHVKQKAPEGDRNAQIRFAWHTTLGRPPTEEESAWALSLLEMPGIDPTSDSDGQPDPLTVMCHALMTCNEFLYLH